MRGAGKGGHPLRKWGGAEAPEDQKRYIDTHVQHRIEQERDNYNCMSYDEYKRYYQEGCEYTEKFFTTEHGDEVAAFGKGGWD